MILCLQNIIYGQTSKGLLRIPNLSNTYQKAQYIMEMLEIPKLYSTFQSKNVINTH